MGRVISSSFNNDVLTAEPDPAPVPAGAVAQHPATSVFDFHEPVRGLVEGLQGVKKGERRTIFVNAERAYGYYDPSLVMKISRRKLPQGETLQVGFQVVTQTEDGDCRVFRVIEADGVTVTLDGNHPLAGQDLCFDIEATATREATREELEQARAATRLVPRVH